jgi:hypothetical protein
VLAVFRSRWGEVDGYLPVLYRLKQRHPDWNLIAVLLSPGLVKQAEQQPFLYEQLKEVADVLILPHSTSSQTNAISEDNEEPGSSNFLERMEGFLWRLGFRYGSLLRYLRAQPIRVVLKDHGGEDRFLNRLDQLLKPRWVAYPHGTGLYIEAPSDPGRSFRESAAHLVLVGHEPEVACFERMLGQRPDRSFCALGHPRYDAWWMERLAQTDEFRASEEVRRAAQFKRTFLFATRGPAEQFLPLATFQDLCRSVGRVVLKDPNNFLLVKPHPKQDFSLLKAQFAEHDPQRWMISSFQTTQLAALSDFVICMVSGVILDALAARKPTVEYFRYLPGDESFFRDQSGRTISAYAQLGLVPAAQSENELEGLIEDYFGARSKRWEEYRRTTDAFMRLDNKSSDRVVNAIDNLLQPRQPSRV